VSTNLDFSTRELTNGHLVVENGAAPQDRSRQTRQIYDIVASLYPLSSRLFHSRAHKAALQAAQIEDGGTILEVATGSGEMLRKLTRRNPAGCTVGVDLSPNMAARSQSTTRAKFPKSAVHCQAADVRQLPFATHSFDTVVCCYLFELLPEGALVATLEEINRVLRPDGRLVTVLVGQNKASFNAMYKVCNKIAPAFWGQQVEKRVVHMLEASGYQLEHDRHVRQIYYSSRVIAARRS
jgi:ubiquinone/menaquinone biosynthesis C-methylase UbiE